MAHGEQVVTVTIKPGDLVRTIGQDSGRIELYTCFWNCDHKDEYITYIYGDVLGLVVKLIPRGVDDQGRLADEAIVLAGDKFVPMLVRFLAVVQEGTHS